MDHIKPPMDIIAHRGASGLFPENTELAISQANNLGADIIEFDVQRTKDGEFVIFHDWNLERIAGNTRTIPELTFDKLFKIDVGSHFEKKYHEIRVPKLDDILFSHGNFDFIIEIKKKMKDKNSHYSYLSELLEVLENHKYRPRKGYISVRDFDTYTIIKEMSNIRVGVMQKKLECDEYHELLVENEVKIAQIRWLRYNQDKIIDLKHITKTINAFPAHTPEEWKTLYYWGVSGVLTNYPGQLKSWLASLNTVSNQ